MITLYTFGPAFGLPDPSPFVTKAEVLLKLSGLPYHTDTTGFSKAPKGKLPYLDDDGTLVPDSTLIRLHLESRHGIDFDKGLTTAHKACLWAVEKMLEDHLYWMAMRERWGDANNFDKGPRKFFDSVPALMRPFVVAMIRRTVKRNLQSQGAGRLTDDEISRLAARAIQAFADILGDKPWLGGDDPRGADATGFAFIAGLLCPLFDSELRLLASRYDNLKAYSARGYERWYPALMKTP